MRSGLAAVKVASPLVSFFLHRFGFEAGRGNPLRLFVVPAHQLGWRSSFRQEISRFLNYFFTSRRIDVAFSNTFHPGGLTSSRWAVRSGFSPVRPPVLALVSPGSDLF